MTLLAFGLLAACSGGEDDPSAWPGSFPNNRVPIDGTTYGQGKEDANPTAYGDEWKENEQPQHSVSLSPYAIDRTEVTVDQWAQFLTAIGSAAQAFHHPLQPVDWDGAAWASQPEQDSTPARYVSWHDAVAFCAWASGRLPTEAEWELAAKGEEGDSRYPWGSDGATCERAVYFTNRALCETGPQPVGSRSPLGDSPFGLSDMAGNVAEWVSDRYGRYSEDTLSDPLGDEDSAYRVMRGGGFRDVDDSIRTTARWGVLPDRRSEGVGFRCAQDQASGGSR